MTVENLMNSFAQYVSWLYSQREWARWELLTVAITAFVLLLLALIHQRKASAKKAKTKQIEERSSTIGINLDAGNRIPQELESDVNSHRIVSISKNNGNHKGWKETTKKWKSYQKLIEQLQQEIANYKKAEQCLEQQFAKLKAANEQLRREITSSNKVVQDTEISHSRAIGSFSKQQSRMLNTSEVLADDN